MSMEGAIWTIGHSNHDLPTLVDLLRGERIDVVADVRSQPYSRFNPHFNREPLQSFLTETNLSYVFLGEQLGGRPSDGELFDAAGHVLYGEVAKTSRFLKGIDRLLEGSARYRVALMCAEENPSNCHRRLLVSRALVERGSSVIHIRGNGATISEAELEAELARSVQPSLFGEDDLPDA